MQVSSSANERVGVLPIMKLFFLVLTLGCDLMESETGEGAWGGTLEPGIHL